MANERAQEVAGLHRIDDNDLIVSEQPMYRGPNSESYRGIYGSRQVFVKRFPAAEKVFFEEEALIFSKLKHDNIVEFIGIRINEENYEIVTEFLEGGSLQEFLESYRWGSKTFSLQQGIGYALDIARAMEYVHQKKFVYRDLKPDNILLTELEDRAVLIDFGHATKEDLNGMEGAVGTSLWMAPEVMPKGQRVPYDHKTDVYSFSIVLWELVTLRRPYQDQEKFMDEIMEGIRTHEIRPVLKDIKIPELAALLTSCWDAEPASRPEFSEIITRLQEILHKLDQAPETVLHDQPGNGQGGDAP